MSRTISLNLLDRVQIATPCTARWEDMAGDDKIRHCAQCNLKVHNFSAMTTDEAESLLRAHFGEGGAGKDGRLCGGWYRRTDGTAIMADCPVGLAKVKAAGKRLVVGLCALSGLTAILGVIAAHGAQLVEDGNEEGRRVQYMAPFARLSEWLRPRAQVLGGVICIPPPPPAQQSAPATDEGGDAP